MKKATLDEKPHGGGLSPRRWRCWRPVAAWDASAVRDVHGWYCGGCQAGCGAPSTGPSERRPTQEVHVALHSLMAILNCVHTHTMRHKSNALVAGLYRQSALRLSFVSLRRTSALLTDSPWNPSMEMHDRATDNNREWSLQCDKRC